MNGRDRERKYREIVSRDGEYCHLCGALPTERQLVIHHIDNNNYHNNTSNLTLLCRTCNYTIHPRLAERPVDMCESSTSHPTALSVNRMKERGYRRYVYDRIINSSNVDYKRLIISSAEFMSISPVTSKRYLDKMCSSEGILSRKFGVVRFKENWEELVNATDVDLIKEIIEIKNFLEKEDSND